MNRYANIINQYAVYLRSLMEVKKYLLIIVLLSLIFSSNIYAQLDNSGLFYDPRNMDSSEVGDLNFEIYSLAFNKNNEYYEQIATGYTFFGYLLRPELSYHLDKDFYVKVGMISRKDFGNDDFTVFQPTFLLRYDWQNFQFNFGTIYGPLEHQYLEPIYDFERIVSANPENGLQILYNDSLISADAWISWNKMIYDRSPFREEFNGGLNLKLNLLNSKRFGLQMPLQSIATHVGGQIDNDPNPARTVTNFAAGLNVDYHMFGNFFKTFTLNANYLTYYSLESESLIPPYRDGRGLFLNLNIKSHAGSVMISYWDGHEFSSWNGGHLYQSTTKNWREPFALEENRQVIIIRFLNDIALKNNLRILPRLEPYWNLNTGKFGFSMGLYVRLQEYFKLTNVKPGKN